MSNYAVIDSEAGLVDVYASLDLAKDRARAIAGVVKPSESREYKRSNALAAFRHFRDKQAANPVWIEATEAPISDGPDIPADERTSNPNPQTASIQTQKKEPA